LKYIKYVNKKSRPAKQGNGQRTDGRAITLSDYYCRRRHANTSGLSANLGKLIHTKY